MQHSSSCNGAYSRIVYLGCAGVSLETHSVLEVVILRPLETCRKDIFFRERSLATPLFSLSPLYPLPSLLFISPYIFVVVVISWWTSLWGVLIKDPGPGENPRSSAALPSPLDMIEGFQLPGARDSSPSSTWAFQWGH